jgi:hypothetical protein
MNAMTTGKVFSATLASLLLMPLGLSMDQEHQMELSWPSLYGMVYVPESTVDFQNWSSGSPIFGSGALQAVSIPGTGTSRAFWRLRAFEQPQIGWATWDIAGKSLELTMLGESRTWNFSSTLATSQGLSLDYQFLRRGLHTCQCTILHASGETELLMLEFLAPSVGTFSREFRSVSAAVPHTVHQGVFTLGNLPGSLAPVSFPTGKVIWVDEAGALTTTVFGSQCTQSMPGMSQNASFLYARTSTTTANFQIGTGTLYQDQCQIAFLGTHTGTFQRTQTRSNEQDTDSGLFILVPN